MVLKVSGKFTKQNFVLNNEVLNVFWNWAYFFPVSQKFRKGSVLNQRKIFKKKLFSVSTTTDRIFNE